MDHAPAARRGARRSGSAALAACAADPGWCPATAAAFARRSGGKAAAAAASPATTQRRSSSDGAILHNVVLLILSASCPGLLSDVTPETELCAIVLTKFSWLTLCKLLQVWEHTGQMRIQAPGASVTESQVAAELAGISDDELILALQVPLNKPRFVL